MKRQLSFIDSTHEMLCISEKQAKDGIAKARKKHRGQQAAILIHQAIVNAKLKYEIKRGLISPSTKIGKAA